MNASVLIIEFSQRNVWLTGYDIIMAEIMDQESEVTSWTEVGRLGYLHVDKVPSLYHVMRYLDILHPVLCCQDPYIRLPMTCLPNNVCYKVFYGTCIGVFEYVSFGEGVKTWSIWEER